MSACGIFDSTSDTRIIAWAHLADGRGRVIARPVGAGILMVAVELRRDGFRGHDSSGNNTRPTGLRLRLPRAGAASRRPTGDGRCPPRNALAKTKHDGTVVTLKDYAKERR